MKTTYVDSVNKIAVRNFLLQLFSFKRVVGLAGPDINEYVAYFMSKGYEDFELYEENRDVFLKQMLTVKPAGSVSLIHGDIYNALLRDDTLYDLDFCCTIKHAREHVIKFDNNFIMTFSARYGIQKTIGEFFFLRNERVLETIEDEKWNVIMTDESRYVFVSYRDVAPMCCIANSSLLNI